MVAAAAAFGACAAGGEAGAFPMLQPVRTSAPDPSSR